MGLSIALNRASIDIVVIGWRNRADKVCVEEVWKARTDSPIPFLSLFPTHSLTHSLACRLYPLLLYHIVKSLCLSDHFRSIDIDTPTQSLMPCCYYLFSFIKCLIVQVSIRDWLPLNWERNRERGSFVSKTEGRYCVQRKLE